MGKVHVTWVHYYEKVVFVCEEYKILNVTIVFDGMIAHIYKMSERPSLRVPETDPSVHSSCSYVQVTHSKGQDISSVSVFLDESLW